MTQKDLADLLGKKESEISKWMTGTHNFTIRSIAKIESALDVSIFDIEKKKQSDSEILKANTSDFLTILLKGRHSQKYNPIIKRNLDLTLMFR